MLLPEPLGPMMAWTSPALTLEVDALEDLASLDLGVQVLDLEHPVFLVSLLRSLPVQPTLPSRLTSSSFCASTANSIGSSRKTSLQKPLTIIDTASSVEMPRCRQ